MSCRPVQACLFRFREEVVCQPVTSYPTLEPEPDRLGQMRTSIENQRLAYSLAVPQHGVVGRRQLLSAGLPAGTIGHWSSSGKLIGLFAAVYALGRPVTSDEAFWMAATLAGGPDAFLTGRAGAAAWGFGDPPREIEVIRPNGGNRRIHTDPPHRSATVKIHRGRLRPHEQCHLGPVPVVGPGRVLADLAGQTTPRGLRRYFLEAGRTGHLTTACLAKMRASGRRYRGRSELIRLVELWVPDKGDLKSLLEAELRMVCAEYSVPIPETNRKIGPDEVDAVWWDAKLVAELDGRKFHGDSFAHRDDAEKTRRLRALGFLVLRFTWEEVTGSPEVVAARILLELERRAPGLLPG